MQPRGNGQQQAMTVGQQGRQMATDQPPHPVDVFRERLVRQKGAIELLIPRRIRREFPPQRIMVVAVNAYRRMLMAQKSDASPPDVESTIDAVVAMAQLGLEAGTEQAYLVPYKGKVQAIVGPRGYVDLALRHPKMRTCVARVVLAGDEFDYDLGTSRITHKKGVHATAQKERAASVEYAWARYVTTNGGEEIEVLTREDIEFYRSFSQAKFGPWIDNYEGMARKTVLKRLLSYAPRDTFMSLALNEDGEGAYNPGLSAQEVKETIDSAEQVAVQVPSALPQRQTQSAAEQIPEERKSDPAPARRGYGDDADNFHGNSE